MSESPSNAVLTLLAGVAIGAGLGILFAPDSGRRTRQKIKEGIDAYSDELQQQLQELNRKVRTAAGEKQDHLQEAVDDLMAEAGENTEMLIAELEVRLAQLRSRLAQSRTDAP